MVTLKGRDRKEVNTIALLRHTLCKAHLLCKGMLAWRKDCSAQPQLSVTKYLVLDSVTEYGVSPDASLSARYPATFCGAHY